MITLVDDKDSILVVHRHVTWIFKKALLSATSTELSYKNSVGVEHLNPIRCVRHEKLPIIVHGAIKGCGELSLALSRLSKTCTRWLPESHTNRWPFSMKQIPLGKLKQP